MFEKYPIRGKEEHGKYEFNISREACAPFGFYSGERVNTPMGLATVVGVRINAKEENWKCSCVCDGCSNQPELWFILDGQKGASCWTGYKKDNFLEEGFSKI